MPAEQELLLNLELTHGAAQSGNTSARIATTDCWASIEQGQGEVQHAQVRKWARTHGKPHHPGDRPSDATDQDALTPPGKPTGEAP